MEKELIIITVGAIVSLTLIGVLIGVPIILIGVYLLNKKLKTKNEEKNLINEEYNKKQNIIETRKQYDKKQAELEKLEQELVKTTDNLEMLEYGLYEPKYNFVNATDYKERLDSVRKQQKQMIKDKTAAKRNGGDFLMDGDKRKGRAFINDNIKQILNVFNLECEITINKVKHSNLESSKNRIQKSYDKLNKMYSRTAVTITQGYLNLKFDEMYLAYEYEVKKQEEKELLKEARERERENKKLQKKLQKEKNKFNRENKRINSEIDEYKKQLNDAVAEEKAKLEAEIQKLKETLNKNNDEIDKIDESEKTPGAGYVYIISNIGSFGEGVFKIGVTRRDNPEDRVRELSSASVPFKYDSHVFIFSEDAYALENSLHQRFDKQRVNKVNRRKEFFRISIDDVRLIVEENKASVHSFVEEAEADEYFDTLRIEKSFE